LEEKVTEIMRKQEREAERKKLKAIGSRRGDGK
jgi:hypothetical protein